MLLFFREFEAMFLVDAPGGVEHAVGPQYELLVATVAGEAYALSDEARTETSPAGFWLHEEEAALRSGGPRTEGRVGRPPLVPRPLAACLLACRPVGEDEDAVTV